MYKPFLAQTQGVTDYSTDVIPLAPRGDENVIMTICAIEGAIYITKQQAMDFFGLTDPTTNNACSD